MTDAASVTFAEVLTQIDDVEGWLSDGQARLLWDRAGAVAAGGTIVEIGSYQGRSAIVLGHAADQGVEIVAIDPHAGNDRGPQEIEGPAADGQRDHDAFLANLDAAGVTDRIRHLREFSQTAGDKVEGQCDLVYIDGAHRYAPARDDIRLWGARVADEGTLLIHDSFNAVGVTLAQLRLLLWSGRFRYVGRSRSMAEYHRIDLGGRARLGSALRQLAQLPYVVRNQLIKVLIVLRLKKLTRLLGNPTEEWPY